MAQFVNCLKEVGLWTARVSAAARSDARAAARGARGAARAGARAGIEGRDRAWCGQPGALFAVEEDRARPGVEAVRGGEHGVPLASRFLRRRGAIRRCSRGSWYVLESRKGARGLGRKARRRGGKAKKRGLSREQVPVLMAADRSGTTVSAVLPRVDAAALTAALDPVVAKDALLVSDGGASYPPCAAALGVSHEALNRSMGERVRGDLQATVNSRHSRSSCVPAAASPPADNYLPRRPRPRRQTGPVSPPP